MRKKDVSFRYLEFSRAIGENQATRAAARLPGAGTEAGVRVTDVGVGAGAGATRPVLFESGHTGLVR